MSKLVNIILSLCTLILLFLLSEFLFRKYLSHNMVYGMEMHKYAKKLKRTSSVEKLSHEHIPSKEATLMGVKININDFGIRDNFLPKIKNNNEKRILVVGSSITLGWGVEYDSIFTTRLEKALNNDINIKYEVINAGIGNYNTKMEVIYAKNILPKVDPDKVILHFFLNDVEQSQANNSFLIRNSYLVAQLYIKIKQWQFRKNNNYNSIGEYYFGMFKEKNNGLVSSQNSIMSLAKECENKDIDFLVLLQPDLNNLSYSSYQYKCHKIMRKFLIDNNISYHDLFEDFSKEYANDPKQLWVSHDDSHPNSKGHKIIFQSLIKYIRNKIAG